MEHSAITKNSIADIVLHFPDGLEMVICVLPSKFIDICLSDIDNVTVPRSHRREAVENIDTTLHPMEVDTHNVVPPSGASDDSDALYGNSKTGHE